MCTLHARTVHTARTHCARCTHALCTLHAHIVHAARTHCAHCTHALSTLHARTHCAHCTHALCTLHAGTVHTARMHGVCCAWLWDRLFGRRGHRREEHEGGGGGTRGFDTRAGWSVVCRLCLPLIADTVSMLWTLKDNIWQGEPSAHFLNHGPLASFACAHGYRHGHLWPLPLPIF